MDSTCLSVIKAPHSQTKNPVRGGVEAVADQSSMKTYQHMGGIDEPSSFSMGNVTSRNCSKQNKHIGNRKHNFPFELSNKLNYFQCHNERRGPLYPATTLFFQWEHKTRLSLMESPHWVLQSPSRNKRRSNLPARFSLLGKRRRTRNRAFERRT